MACRGISLLALRQDIELRRVQKRKMPGSTELARPTVASCTDLAHMQGKRLSHTADETALGEVERSKKPGNTELAFSAEGKVLSCRFYVCDGLVHALPPAAKEVRESVIRPLPWHLRT